MPHDMLGYHCTRLCDDEIQHIRKEGMAPSSVQSLANRINTRTAAGDISASVVNRLLHENQASDGNRTGMIWFVNGDSNLRDESGLYRLFRHWGGEALYGLHERDSETGPLLRRLGQPSIVIASVPIADYRTFRLIGETLYAAFMESKGIETENSIGTEGYMPVPIPAERVARIIRFSDPDFERLTKCSTWRLGIG